MNKLEQAARQIVVDWDSGIHLYEAITALREALKQPDIEEMTFSQIDAKYAQQKQGDDRNKTLWDRSCYKCKQRTCDGTCKEQSYTAPQKREWVELTKEDKLALWKKWNMTAAQIDAVIASFKEANE